MGSLNATHGAALGGSQREANRVEVRERRTGVASPQRLARRILLVNRNVRNIVASDPVVRN